MDKTRTDKMRTDKMRTDKTKVPEILNDYIKIDSKWMKLHYMTLTGLVVFSVFVEIIIDIIMSNTDELHSTIPIFILKFLIIPAAINTLCIIINCITYHSDNITQERKIYIISLLLVVICFVLFTAHNVFSVLYIIFTIPILMTTVYANYRLTVVTSVTSMVAVMISKLFIKWDIDKVDVWEDPYVLGDFLISLFILIAFSAVCMVTIRYAREKNALSIQIEIERYQLEHKLLIDELTGIFNRNALSNAIREMEEDHTENTYVFVMIDIDNFKKLNDSLGHLKGDRCLMEFGRVLKANCGDALPFRFGGDEFCILFLNATIDQVYQICEKIRMEYMLVKVDKKSDMTLTASFGIATYNKKMPASKLMAHTDKALYEAKKDKNSICIYQDKKTIDDSIKNNDR